MILLTGANGGIAQHIARHLLELGRRDIVLHYRSDRNNIDALLAEFSLPESHACRADLCDETSVEALRERIERHYGLVTRLVNVAGSSTNAVSWKLSAENFTKVLNDNLLSTFLCCKAFVPGMRERRFGRIVNFSSIVGSTGVPGASHYAAAKAGIVGFTKSLALEVANRSIVVNALALGYFDTGLIADVPDAMQAELKARIPAGRFGSRHDVGSAVEFLLGDGVGFMTGQVIHLNGGQFG